MYIQPDSRWKDYQITKDVTIGKYGCLLTTLCNILNILNYNFFPDTLADRLKEENGFTAAGFIIWEAIFRVFGIKHTKLFDISKTKFSDDPLKFWIVQVPYKNTGHFCQIIKAEGSDIYYFDVYTGKEKKLIKYISIRELEFTRGKR